MNTAVDMVSLNSRAARSIRLGPKTGARTVCGGKRRANDTVYGLAAGLWTSMSV